MPPGAAADLAAQVEARGLIINVLVNNAGLGGVGPFDRMDTVRIGEMLQVNIVALTELTRLLLPGMIARARGRIMLVGSTAGEAFRNLLVAAPAWETGLSPQTVTLLQGRTNQ